MAFKDGVLWPDRRDSACPRRLLGRWLGHDWRALDLLHWAPDEQRLVTYTEVICMKCGAQCADYPRVYDNYPARPTSPLLQEGQEP